VLAEIHADAVRHHHAGRLVEAERALRTLLAAAPAVAAELAPALHLLGVICYQTSRFPESAELLRRACELAPNEPHSHSLRGAALHALGRCEEALACHRQALALAELDALVLNNLGITHVALGQPASAAEAFAQALRAAPHDAGVRCNLAAVRQSQGRSSEAIALYEEALALRPDLPAAHNNLGNLFHAQGRFDRAEPCFRAALRLAPNFAQGRHNLAQALLARGRAGEASDVLRQALTANPADGVALARLGHCLLSSGRAQEALSCCQEAVRLRPACAESWNHQGNAQQALADLDAAEASYRRAAELAAGWSAPRYNLGVALLGQGRLDESRACMEEALRLGPADALAHSGLVGTLYFCPDVDDATLLQEHRHWAERHARLDAPLAPLANAPQPQRRLRVGYVSPDFRNHAVAFFVAPLLVHHDPEQIDAFCYAEVAAPDEMTASLRRLAPHWRDTVGLGDDQLADLIRHDGIDVLVELAGHTANHRLRALARRAAPVQISYLGYPGTTGVPPIDYRLGDAITDPPEAPAPYSEELVRLPGPFCCYAPPRGPAAELATRLPEERAGYLTFGALHKLEKLNDGVIDLWCSVLQRVPAARLLLARNTLRGATAERLRQRFGQRGLAPERLLLEAPAAVGMAHLRLYDRIDVALDAFPFSGHTTACEALWMGAPVVTLRGARHAGRLVASVLTAVGLTELVADTTEGYAQIAVALAADRARRAAWRANLREQVRRSPLCDGRTFTRALEHTYRDLWRRWCAQRPLPASPAPSKLALEAPAPAAPAGPVEEKPMTLRYLLGPVSAERAARWQGPRQAGACRAFNAAASLDLPVTTADNWELVGRRLPDDWRPDVLVLDLDRTTVPAWLWTAPVPLVALAPDWRTQWHHYRQVLPLCDLVLTDAAGAEVMRQAGCHHARVVNLCGLPRAVVQAARLSGLPEEPRDIDVLWAGEARGPAHRQALPWLARLARLGPRWRVRIVPAASGDDYPALARRSRIVFHDGSASASRALEAIVAGALLFQGPATEEDSALLRHGQEHVRCTEDNLEAQLQRYLTNEDERRALVEADRQRLREFPFEVAWDGALKTIEQEWPALCERARARLSLPEEGALLARTWQALGAAEGDPALLGDLSAALPRSPRPAALHNALGLLSALAGRDQRGQMSADAVRQAAEHFGRALALDPANGLFALNLIEALAVLGQHAAAVEGAHRLLALLGRGDGLGPAALAAAHFPPVLDHFRLAWERAAWENAGRPEREKQAKALLVRWRVHEVLAALSGELSHFHEAALLRPDVSPTRAALGCALARAGNFVDAAWHLRAAVEVSPFDHAAARALYQALTDAGDATGAATFAQERWLLHQAMPAEAPPEWWFAPAPPAGEALPADHRYATAFDGLCAALPEPACLVAANGAAADLVVGTGRPRVSLCVIVKNEEDNLPACLGSVAGLFDEIVVVDTGSTDNTKEIALGCGARVFDFPWVDSFSAARNECLGHATGEYIFWLDADDRLDDDNHEKLRALLAGLRHENVAYSLKCRCVAATANDHETEVDHIRLFRNHPSIRWRYRVHEQILPAVRAAGGQVRWADVVIRHTGYQDRALRQRKLHRDLRLLELERAEQPDDPFTLFNLGSVHHELGHHAESLPLLRRSLERSHPRDSIVRKLYSLLASCHGQLRQPEQALAVCAEGRRVCPDDAELLFLEGALRQEVGDLHGARAVLLLLLQGPAPGEHFASTDPGLRSYRARCVLAGVCRQLGELGEAEALLHAVLAERPGFLGGWAELGQVLLSAQRWDDLGPVIDILASHPQGELESLLLRARMHLARKEFAPARSVLGQAIERWPEALLPRIVLSYAWLQEGHDLAAAERALHDVLRLDPTNGEAQRNLNVLLGERVRARDAAFVRGPQGEPGA
jgi:predicted O-linked N-acetylglucosamine transferase (SPINDLY family)